MLILLQSSRGWLCETSCKYKISVIVKNIRTQQTNNYTKHNIVSAVAGCIVVASNEEDGWCIISGLFNR